jgi:DNA-directed RNA polymerase specialized sigma24 family protein
MKDHDSTTVDPLESLARPGLSERRHAAEQPTPAVAGAHSEQGLVDQCLDGNEDAWEKLFRRNQPFLLEAIRVLLRPGTADANLVEEIASRVWYALFRNGNRVLARYNPDNGQPLSAFLMGMARREILLYMRAERRKSARELAAARKMSRQRASEAEVAVLFSEFTAQLTESEREFIEDLLVDQSATKGNACHVRPSGNRVRQARRRLRLKLEAFLKME